MGTLPMDPGQAQRTAAIISASFIMSVLMYGVVVSLFRITAQGPFGGFLRLPQILPVRAALWGLAAAALAASSILQILLYFPRSDAWEEWLKQRP